ncbi:hypothetical protein ASF35_01780 [Aeromicrobium sp. Leaf291]|nr:hypothetical protein ASF35_01780 [Aeromicrobium sp. Leaf291]
MDELRALNAALSILTAAMLWVRFNDRPRTIPRSGRVMRHGIVAAFAVGSLGSIEHLRHGSDFTAASVAWALVCCVILGALWTSRKH